MRKKKEFNTEEFARLFDAASDNADRLVVEQQKKLVLMIGPTGSGKSTATNIFTRKPMKTVQGSYGQRNLVVDPEYRGDAAAKIGHTKESMTTHPSIYYEEGGTYAYCDCAGFSDTRGDACDIATALSTLMTIMRAGSFAAVLVHISYGAFDAERGSLVTKLSELLSGFFVDTSALNASLGVCISRAPDYVTAADIAKGLSEEDSILGSISEDQVILVNYDQVKVEDVETFLATRKSVLSNNFRLVLPEQTSSSLMLWADSEFRQADALLAQQDQVKERLRDIVTQQQDLQAAERAAAELSRLREGIAALNHHIDGLHQSKGELDIALQTIDKAEDELREEAFILVSGATFAKEVTFPADYSGIYRRQVTIDGVIDKVIPELPEGGKLYQEKFTGRGYTAFFEMAVEADQTFQIIVKGMGRKQLQPEVIAAQQQLKEERLGIHRELLQIRAQLTSGDRELTRLCQRQAHLIDDLSKHVDCPSDRLIEQVVFAESQRLSEAQAEITESLGQVQAGLDQQKGSLDTLELLCGFNQTILGAEQYERLTELLRHFSPTSHARVSSLQGSMFDGRRSSRLSQDPSAGEQKMNYR